MKRILLILLCACLLLSGCRTAVQTTLPETQAPVVPLLEQGVVQKESPNLRYIPSQIVEEMMSPDLHLLGNGLLLSELHENSMVLKLLNQEDGTLLAESEVPAAPATTLFIGSERVGLCDRLSGQITILDDLLQLLQTYNITADGDDWYLDSDLDTLYIFAADRGLMSVDLETGAENWIIDNGFRVFCKGVGEDFLIFSYVDRADQRTYNRCLTMSTGTMEPLPTDGPIFEGNRHGDTWLLLPSEADGTHTLVCDGVTSCFTWKDSNVDLLPVRQELLMTDPSGRNLILYGSDGSFHSECALPLGSENFVASDLLWSEYWGGYFFMDFTGSFCRLMFWDVQLDSSGERLEILPVDNIQPPEPLLESRLYERAAELSQRFGVEICIGEQCSLVYTHYESSPLTDPEFVRSALEILESALSQYPEGFFRQLRHDSVKTIRIELVSSLVIREDGMIHPAAAAGIAQKQGIRYIVALNGFILNEETVYHEIAHIISARLEWDSLIREDALYSEDAWMALQPEGFNYALVYSNIPTEYQLYIDAGYFINEYSMSFSTEDRSEVMAKAMSLEHWLFEHGTGRREKLQFYADCIRDCFDTSGWPEVTRWERVLG